MADDQQPEVVVMQIEGRKEWLVRFFLRFLQYLGVHALGWLYYNASAGGVVVDPHEAKKGRGG